MQIKNRIPMTSSSLPIHNKSNSGIQHHQRVPILLSPFVLALLLSLSFLFFLSFQIPHHRPIAPASSNFSHIFYHLQSLHLLSNSSSSHTLIISLSSNQNQDIQVALRQTGFAGQVTETSKFSSQLPFEDGNFELVFSNAFEEEAIDCAKLAQEVERLLKNGGVCCMLLVGGTSQVEKVTQLFEFSDVVEVRQVVGFGSLHTQVVLKKNQNKMKN